MAKGDIMSQRQMKNLNPRPLTFNPDFLRNGCLSTCFPFVLSSQTESAAVRGRKDVSGRGPEVWDPPFYLPQSFLSEALRPC